VSDERVVVRFCIRPVNRAFVLLATTDIRKPRGKVMYESQGAKSGPGIGW
jgi:hypothetical protein